MWWWHFTKQWVNFLPWIVCQVYLHYSHRGITYYFAGGFIRMVCKACSPQQFSENWLFGMDTGLVLCYLAEFHNTEPHNYIIIFTDLGKRGIAIPVASSFLYETNRNYQNRCADYLKFPFNVVCSRNHTSSDEWYLICLRGIFTGGDSSWGYRRIL